MNRAHWLSKLRNALPEPWEAETLICDVLSCTRADLFAHPEMPVDDPKAERLEQYLKRRLQNEPLAYILGYKDFYRHRFVVGPGVLIPRNETELLVEEALRLLEGENICVADFGCGSGCIGLSLLAEHPSAQLIAIDASDSALFFAKTNAKNLGLENRVQWVHGRVENWMSDSLVDLIVANPPYIAFDDEEVEVSVKDFEPHAALFAENLGLKYYESWFAKAKRVLRPGGSIVFEMGMGQSREVQNILSKQNAFHDFRIRKDYAGIDRVLIAKRGGKSNG